MIQKIKDFLNIELIHKKYLGTFLVDLFLIFLSIFLMFLMSYLAIILINFDSGYRYEINTNGKTYITKEKPYILNNCVSFENISLCNQNIEIKELYKK